MNVFIAQCKRQLPAVVLAVFAFWVLPGHAAGERSVADYSLAALPAWVAKVEPGSARPDSDAVGGQRYLLLDRQYRDDGKTVAYHHHRVTEVVGQAGLSDNSNLSISFDPGYQRLELHSAIVLRDGLESDRLDRARVNIARTENNSQQNLLNGEVTALVVLPDVRVGDRVDIRYTIYGRNPVFGARHDSNWRVRWSIPIERSVLRITVPRSTTLTHTPRPEAGFSEDIGARLRTLQWQWDELEPSNADNNTPDWFPDSDRLELTEYRNWQEVADWGANLFAGHSAEGETYRRLSNSIQQVANSQGLQPAIAMAIDHVQKRIRYYGVELGENSHRPHAPDEVLHNGYGDCKDKALLLTSLLDDLDVKAWPILVSSRTRRGIVNRLPSPGVFNHVVVLVEQAGEQYWVDATDNSQSGLLGYRGQPEYGAGLVLGKAGDSLITRKAPTPKQPTSTKHDRFYLSSMGGPVDFVTSTTFRGREANRFRRNLDKNGKRRLHKQYLEFYRSMHGELQSLGPIRIAEDELSNTITVTKSYRLDEFWNVDSRSQVAEFDAYAINISRRLDELPRLDRNRKAPLPITGPIKVAHRIQFYPNVASPERALEERTFGLDGFRYSDSEYVLGDSLVFDSELEVSTDELAADQVKTYNKFRQRVLRNAQSGRYYRQIDKDEFALGSTTSTLLDELGELYQ